MIKRLFRLRPFRPPEAKARLIAMIPLGDDGEPATPGLADILGVLRRYRLQPGDVRWFRQAIKVEAARAAGGDDDDEED